MMTDLFNEQALREQYEIAHDRELLEQGKAEGIAKGKAEGIAEGRVKGILETLVELVKKGILTIVQAADEAQMSVSEFEALTGLRQA